MNQGRVFQVVVSFTEQQVWLIIFIVVAICVTLTLIMILSRKLDQILLFQIKQLEMSQHELDATEKILDEAAPAIRSARRAKANKDLRIDAYRYP